MRFASHTKTFCRQHMAQRLAIPLFLLLSIAFAISCNGIATEPRYIGDALHNPLRIKSVVEEAMSGGPGGWHLTEKPQVLWGIATTHQAARDLIDDLQNQEHSPQEQPDRQTLIYLMYGEIDARVNTISGEHKIYDTWVYIEMDVETGNRGGKGSWGPDRNINPDLPPIVQLEVPANFDDIPQLSTKPYPAASPATPAPSATPPAK